MLIERSDGQQDCDVCGTTIAEGIPLVRNADLLARATTVCSFCVTEAFKRIAALKGVAHAD